MVIEGIVEQGKHLGRTLGFPTANVRPEAVSGEWPENGVYAAALWPEGERARLCMLNQGVHPTLPEGKPTIEAHLIDYQGDLYGRPVRVEYLRFLRPERRFSDVEALRAQLLRDREEVCAWLDAAMLAENPDPAQARARRIAWADRPGE